MEADRWGFPAKRRWLPQTGQLCVSYRQMKKSSVFASLCFGLLVLPLITCGDTRPAQPIPLAPGYGDLAYTPAAPGTYHLPALGPAQDGEVLKTDGQVARLHDLFGDKYVLFSFIYSTCSDVNGCPLATAVLARIKHRLDQDPEIADKLRLISLSFDPRHDTPEVMRLYGNSFAVGRGEWQFLTTESRRTLDPILKAYHQSILPDYDSNGEISGAFSHILRVFLIDLQMQVRNIYSVSFLHPDILVNDVKTLLMEDQGRIAATRNDAHPMVGSEPPATPGDFKQGYETDKYHTDSVSLDRRHGKTADLMALVRQPPLGLPKVPVPADNPVTEKKIVLGRKLFYDRRMSLNNTISCAMCHIPEQGFTSNEMALAVGIEGRTVRRNAPTIYNSAYLTRLFLDGRETRLEQQVWGPLLASNEMGNPSIAVVINKIRHISSYDGLFEEAFDGKGPGMETIGQALASYERTLISANSPFDRWYFDEDPRVISAAAKRGFALFTGKAACASCHLINENYALFTDNAMHNTGLGWFAAMAKTPETTRVLVAPGVYLDVDESVIDAVGNARLSDIGLYEVTQDPADRWRYRTPSLRNVALTAPYMHDGSLETLRDVVEFYNRGGYPNENLDPLIHPLELSEGEVGHLVDFLKSLTGDNVSMLVSDAFAAPVGDPRDHDAERTRDSKGGL